MAERARAVMAVLVLGLATGRAEAQDLKQKKQSQLVRTEDERIAAMVKGDLQTLERILGGDLTYAHASGKLETKRELLDAIKDGTYKYHSFQRQNVVTRFYADNAVITGKAVIRMVRGGEELNVSVLCIGVYAWRHERWEMVAWQSTRLPAP